MSSAAVSLVVEHPEGNNSEEEKGFKVFVGNLSYQTKESDLDTVFSSVGKVTNVNILTYNDRSRGYGFVTFDKEEEADIAINVINKKEVNGREINVEKATPRDVFRGRGGRRGRGTFQGRGGFRGSLRGGGSFRGSIRGGGAGVGEGAAAATGGGSFRGTRGRGGAPRREKRDPGEPSKTTLFVANLAYKTTDESLKAHFEKFNAVKARVITRGTFSKGFGFVEFANEVDQQNALKEMDNIECESRRLTVRIALGEEHPPLSNSNEEVSVAEK